MDNSFFQDVSIHATLAGGDLGMPNAAAATPVSIHATLAGGDPVQFTDLPRGMSFYPRHPRGWRPAQTAMQHALLCFYPRHPRGWRPAASSMAGFLIFSFYPRHPRGWRRHRLRHSHPCRAVSIHATLAGGDSSMFSGVTPAECFYPRHPRGWRLWILPRIRSTSQSFYPRHPRGWRPRLPTCPACRARCFYPRHPRGWRPIASPFFTVPGLFLSTPPSRVAT